MNAADRSQFLRTLHARRETIAESWYKALASTNSFIPLKAGKVRRHLVELTEQAIALLLTEPFEHGQAREIGAALARLHYVQPEALGRTLEVLARQLVQGLPADQAVVLQPRLAALLGGLATGFSQQVRETILAGQEQIRSALITERKQAEEAMRESEASLANAQRIAHIGNWDYDVATNELYWSDEIYRIFGLQPHEFGVTYEAFLNSVHPDDRGDIKRSVNKALYEHAAYDIDHRIVLPSGKVRLVHEQGEVTFDEHDKPIRMVGTVQDITERKRAEQALRRSEETARALLNAPTDPALLLDLDGTIVALNEAATERLGGSASELVGACVFDLFPPDIAEHRRNQCAQVVRSGQPVRFEDEREARRFDHSVYPVFDAEGKVTQLAVLARDITERKRAEQQAARAERLAAIGRLAAAMAHEINNPLQAIQTNLELVLDFDLEPDEREEYLHVVSQEIQRLTEITRRVLDFARPADDTRYPVPIAHLIQETLKLAGKQLQLAHVRATTDLPTDLPSVFVAPDQILQVLLNLSVNAIEAMPDGGHLHIAARAGESIVEIALTNDGPPLPAEHIERIFDPFFTTKPDGVGLGLSVSHTIVHRHGGTISVKNLKDNRGVTFTITLPIARLKEQEVIV